MIDLSNNNGGAINFRKVYAVGHRRCYLKVTEGTRFVDATYAQRRLAAKQAKLLTGGYHFAHGQASPKEEADFFLSHVGHLSPKFDLRPCLDLELGTPSRALGLWAAEWVAYVKKHVGKRPAVAYSYASFIESCHLGQPIGPLWLAAYGRNNGVEHPYSIPRPWKKIAAHQFCSQARVPGVEGYADISHVFDFSAFTL